MRRSAIVGGMVGCVLAGASPAPAITILHEFSGGAGDGDTPYSTLVFDGSNLLGSTAYGGASDRGTLFVIAPDGSGYSNIHEFTGQPGDGDDPYGAPALVGGTLYGMTVFGGTGDVGSVYSILPGGSNYQMLHSFSGAGGDKPRGAVTVDGGLVYGMTEYGGSGSYGAIFRMNTDGTGFTVLHDFNGTGGSYPRGSLTLLSGTLYGLAQSGGANGDGVLFQISTNGTGFDVLHEFNGLATTNGATPFGSLLTQGGRLYGMTAYGGVNGAGVIFVIDADGTDFSLLHSFAGGGGGANPEGDLVFSDGRLFGLAPQGGTNGAGIVFSIGTDGSGFDVLHAFAGGADDGANPCGSLLAPGDGKLYGVTSGGGDDNRGTLFVIPEPATATLLFGALGGALVMRRRRRRRA